MYCSSSNLGSSRAMHASEAWDASNICLTKMRSVPLIRFLPKMSPSSSTSTGSQIATWTRSLTWTCRELASIFIHRRRERCSSDYTGVSHWTRLSTIFFRTVSHNCLIIIIIIINDSIYPAVSKASRTGNKVSCQGHVSISRLIMIMIMIIVIPSCPLSN